MAILRAIFILFIVTSCAKINYIYEQGIGQFSLLKNAKENEKVIKDVRLPKSQRDKILKIEEYKKYFYQYWNKKERPIYGKTTILKSKAVTYLVVASPFNEVKAIENCFPIMGCFPYLGFFNLESAKDFAKEKEEEGNIVWIRPVYAYSTLGYFTDTILSSFFHYDDIELGELVFHELFHTIFFVKDEVELNENLANYFSEKMLEEYFKTKGQESNLSEYLKNQKEDNEIKSIILKKSLELKELYKSLAPKDKKEANQIFQEFLETSFRPEMEKMCHNKKECFPLKNEWNNARFAAFLTYENRSNELKKLHDKSGLKLMDFYHLIEKKHEEFEKLDKLDKGFSEYLFK